MPENNKTKIESAPEQTQSSLGSENTKPVAAAPMGRGGGFGGGRGGGGGRAFMGPGEKAKNSAQTLKRLWRYLDRHKIKLIIVFLSVLMSSVMMLSGPFFIGKAVDIMAAGKGKVDLAKLWNLVLTLVGVYLAGTFFSWLQIFVMARIAQDTVRDIRKELFAKLQTLSLRYFDARPHGEIMSRLTNDVETINMTLNTSVTQLFSSTVTLLGSLVMMLTLSPILTLLALIIIPLGLLVTTRISKRTRQAFTAQQTELGRLNGYIEEGVSGQHVVKAFGREKAEIAEFDDINVRLKVAGTSAQIYSGTIPPLMNFINNFSYLVVAAAGGALAIAGQFTVGVVAAFLSYSKQFARPINEIANQYNLIQAAIAGAERVFEVLDEQPEIVDAPDSIELKEIKGDVEFRHVYFSYKEGEPVLKDINLHALPGQTIALVGPTGAGKTTIVNLLTRFYDIDSGEILIDGHNIQTIKKDNLRRSLGIVLQDTYLFNGTVRENIRYGRLEATDEEVEAAARACEADDFIRHLPNGYDTVLGEDGGSLSQGQRQILAIARVVLANPSILILDEATSSVDTRTEVNIQKAMLALMEGRTSFVIAHRLSTIRGADNILVIDHGQIVEQGTHAELLKKNGAYAALSNAQLRREAEMRESVNLSV
ncbi:MAG TPA: ABC transporter ATP-binding protein, partial [Spirochaetales bacterium]|nr:ABC transporter ATP-binding protein [Spirochaetales bacterium]HOV94553.1 ABC transporter ATP-binding protein [Spirochaetales bacterium]